MTSDVNLTNALRSNILSLRESENRGQTARTSQDSENIVPASQPAEDITDLGLQNNLSERAQNLSNILDNVATSVQIIEETQNALDRLRDAIGRAIDSANEALDAVRNPDEGAAGRLRQAAQNFAEIRSEIDGIVEQARSNGVNLLNGGALNVAFGANDRAPVELQGVDFSAEGLGIREAFFGTRDQILDTVQQVQSALGAINNFTTEIETALNAIQERQDFVQESVNLLLNAREGLDINSGLDEESINLLALLTRQSLNQNSFSLASEAQRDILRQF